MRGARHLLPASGIPGLTENITVKSIVGRYLEHARVYWFNHNGDERMYIGSADMMNRNLNGRIEVLAPIDHEKIRRNIMNNILRLQLSDTEQSWIMQPTGAYKRYVRAKGVKKVDAQNAQNHLKSLY